MKRNFSRSGLLRIQLGEGVARYPCPAAAKGDAVSDTLLNLLTTSERIPPPSQLLSLNDVLGVAEALGEQVVRLYDFTSPYYAYAKRAAHNALMDILRKTPHNDADEMILSLVAVVDVPSAERSGAEYDSARLAFRIEFQRMLDAIDQVLPLRQHLVARLTLAMRPQFRQALVLIPGTPPILGPKIDETSQIDHAIAMAVTEQNPDRPADENDVSLAFSRQEEMSQCL
ncbi:MAG: hypothetical protein IPK16_01675, partial [Anaerolineales bacterium]|nr:hypothetical protein [Anaerolineales bacterium]